MRIVFMGSPAFAVPTLRALIDSPHEVVAVVTQPDKPAGRGRAWTAPPAKIFAQERGIDVLQPVNVSSPPSVEALRALEPDAIVVAAYGQILRERVLQLPSRGCLNVHASLLPSHRGASPVAGAILAGDEVTGVTIMEMVRALDAGPIVARADEPILPHDTAGSLEGRLSEKGARLLVSVLDDWRARRIEVRPQSDDEATYAPMLKRADARIDWSRSAVEIWRAVRAYNPWPVAFTTLAGEDLRILEAWPVDGDSAAAAGVVVGAGRAGAAGPEAPLVQTGEGRVALVTVQRPGRRSVSGTEFLRGQRNLVGTRLGE